jgi:hypothetical protein
MRRASGREEGKGKGKGRGKSKGEGEASIYPFPGFELPSVELVAKKQLNAVG